MHTLRPTPRRRLWYTAGYTLMAAAGVAASVWPSRSVESAAGALQALIYVWSTFLVVGGVTSAIGSYTDRWLGEYAGLPLLAAVFFVYGVAALAFVALSGPTTIAGGCLFLAVGALIVARWAEVAAIRRAALQTARNDDYNSAEGVS